jgi:pimeloyl-ACP methyl ester carboxylesterase
MPLGALLLVAAFCAHATEPWKRLPPTPDGQFDEGIKPEHLRYLAATIPDARLVVLPKLSHFAMLQDPSAFNSAVLDFLRDYR